MRNHIMLLTVAFIVVVTLTEQLQLQPPTLLLMRIFLVRKWLILPWQMRIWV